MKIRTVILSVLVFGTIFSVVLKATQTSNINRMVGQAINNNDTPQLIKAIISEMKGKMEVDEDCFPDLIKEVEAYITKQTDTATIAVLHSMVAEMYNHYYQTNSWKIDRRTPIEGFIPDDIREWTSNLFTGKIEKELKASLVPRRYLSGVASATFKDIMETGKDSPVLRPGLFEFLAFRALEIRPSNEVYLDLISYYDIRQDLKSAAFVSWAFHKAKYQESYSPEAKERYELFVDSLIKDHQDHPFVVEFVAEKLELLRDKSYDSETADSIRSLQYKRCKETILRYPEYERIGLITNWLASMEEPFIRAGNKNTVYPGKDLEVSLRYKNVPSVTVRIYKSKKTVEESLSYSYKEKTETLGEMVKEASFTLDSKNTYTETDITLRIPMDKPGLYEYLVTSPGLDITAGNLFSVTRLATAARSTAQGLTEILVTDYMSGKPVNGATVNYYVYKDRDYSRAGSVKTDKDGLAALPGNDAVSAYQASTEGDSHLLLTTVYAGRRYDSDQEDLEVRLLTDRGLYRPGQTVFFKGIAYSRSAIVSNKCFEVILRDANYKEVTTQSFTTNEYGSFTGEFTLPRQTLTGRFTLSTANGSVAIQVEEYKRPTFKIDIDPVKEDVAYGDSVAIKGKAQTFSGVLLQGGTVAYRIVRRPFRFRPYNGGNPGNEQVAQGKTAIREDGTFTFSFRPQKSGNHFPLSFDSYDITVSATDSKNETQEARSTFSVGDRSMILRTDIGSQAERESLAVAVTAMTLNGEEIPAKGTYTLITLDDTAKPDTFKEGKQVAEGFFSTDSKLENGIFSKLTSGRYRLKLTTRDSKGREVEGVNDVVLYSRKDTRPPVFTHTWMLAGKTSCFPGETATVVFGTSDKDAYVLYELFSNGKKIEHKRITLNNKNQTFNIPFLESYGDGIIASFTFVKAGELYNQQIPVYKKIPDKSLTIKPETFRDHLLPGSSETWKFRIQDADSAAVLAEVLAGMYDASLDKIAPFAWYFSPFRQPALPFDRFIAGEGFRGRSDYSSQQATYADVPQTVYAGLDWQGMLDTPRSRALFYGRGQAPVMRNMAKADQSSPEERVTEQMAEADAEVAIPGGIGEQAGPAPALRSNFNETAFFFPALLTDKEGNVSISFTIPESNTTWKLQTLAHTKDLKFGLSTHTVVTQKPIMILPNLPRFVRQGDEVNLSAQVINLSEKATGGVVRLELFNPADEQPVGIPIARQPFALEKDGATTVAWSVPIPGGYDLLGIRVIADAELGSDGEQHLLPLLPDELLITESAPFYLQEEGEQHIKLSGSKAPDTRRPYAMTLEFSNNPAWYAVQALPTITLPREDDIVSWFAAYYSNTLAASIARSNPRIKKIIDQWQAQAGTAPTLFSNLEKNEELKNVLLKETPWVLNAESETEQKQRLSLLFDVNRANQQRETALKVLLDRQHESGGWGWFEGFYPSRRITLFILNGMAQLSRLAGVAYNQQEKEMQMRALAFLDKSIAEDYKTLTLTKKPSGDYVPTATQVNFLYIRSYYRDIPEWGNAREGIRYYTSQAGKQWKKMPLHEKGQVALLMYRGGEKEVAGNILSWLRETATTSKEQGMYWANNKRGQDFFHSPTDVHSLLMATFHEIDADTQETDRMKQWLLNQKQTQDWNTLPSTVNAIYSLLATGTDWLAEENRSIIRWGNKTIGQTSGETATGYLKERVEAVDITPLMNTLTIQKEGKTPSWGAVYNQYFEKIDKVGKQSGPLSVEKRLFIETTDGAGRRIVPVTEERPLRTGDKVIVRLTIRTDREMNYVSLKDIRPGCFEPALQTSGYQSADGVVYFHSPKDASEYFYFYRLPAGSYVLEYAAFVSRTGKYSNGIATIQCQYAPEFVSHTGGSLLTVSH
ncbi:MAG: alpha-2-macroglobulin [Tannerellaceae bacterium]|nr:alpha-2-macroglobulin [Tannerellaceae bacterium]